MSVELLAFLTALADSESRLASYYAARGARGAELYRKHADDEAALRAAGRVVEAMGRVEAVAATCIETADCWDAAGWPDQAATIRGIGLALAMETPV